LLARADIARKDLAHALRARGAEVVEVDAYRIVSARPKKGTIERPDYITVTSSSAVRGTLELLAQQGLESWLREIPIVCIGPITEATVRELGYTPAATATEYTISGLIQALETLAQGDLLHA
jgi:uroporphyrinogen-III synthase